MFQLNLTQMKITTILLVLLFVMSCTLHVNAQDDDKKKKSTTERTITSELTLELTTY